MAGSTKERILDAALELFAQNGYAGTNMRDLAQSVGLTKSALYKHYQSKEDIWDSLLDQVAAHYSEGFQRTARALEQVESFDELAELALHMFDFTAHDEKIILARKILLTEQFRNERARSLATEYFLDQMERLFEGAFETMMHRGLMKKDDPSILAFAFVAPVGALVHQLDREPEREAAIFRRVRSFVDHFIREYGLAAGR